MTIGELAFHHCTKLKDVYCYAEQVPECYSSSFSNSNYKQATLHVPATSISAYNAVEPWKDFKEIVELTEEDMDYRPFIDHRGRFSLITIQGKTLSYTEIG